MSKEKANDCGPRKGWVDVPDWIFNASCKKHDEYYIKGGSPADRFKADCLFWWYMKQDVKTQLPRWKRPWGHLVAAAYFAGVRIGGKKHFGS